MSHGDGPVVNAVELVRRHAALAPERRALVNVDAAGRALSTMTYGALVARLDDVARALAYQGVRAGDRVAVFVSAGTDFVVVVYALLQLGAVPVLIDPGMGVKNMLACVREQKPRVVVGVAKAHVLRAIARGAFASVQHAVLVGGRFFPGASSLEALVAASLGAPAVAPFDASEKDVGAIFYTSGSTGPPKGVVSTQAMMAAQAAAIAAMFAAEGAPILPGDVDVACFLPFALCSVALGMTAVFPAMDFRFPAKADPAAVYAALTSTHAASAFASPALWEPFSRWLVAEQKTLPGLRRVLTAGAPVRPSLHERLLPALPDGDVFTPYGATEALPVAVVGGRAILAAHAAKTRSGAGTCVGRIAPGMTVRVVRHGDAPMSALPPALPKGEIGEILVAGPVVTRAYDGRDEATRAAKVDDGAVRWHRMGDLGYLDDDGRLWFCGRRSQRVETAQGLLTSIPVEARAETHAAVQRAALVGVGPLGAQRPVVLVELAPGVQPSPALAEEIGAVAGIDDVLFYPRPFPVDRRHNAKIEREALARWAVDKLPARAAA